MTQSRDFFGDFPNLKCVEVDGCDPIGSQIAAEEAVAWCRAGKGPALIHGHVVRLYSHSMSDDESMYRTADELELARGRCPIDSFGDRLINKKVCKSADLDAVRASVLAEIEAGLAAAEASPDHDPESVFDEVYSADNNGTEAAYRSEPMTDGAGQRYIFCRSDQRCAPHRDGADLGSSSLVKTWLT